MIDINEIQITTLCDNGVGGIEYLAEWGLSLHLKVRGGVEILFDTGEDRACVSNAVVAGIELGRVHAICLSHGHGDHTGGLGSVLKHIGHMRPDREKVDIYCHPAALEDQYVKRSETYFYRGMPYHIEELKQLGAIFHTAKSPVWLTDDIVLSGEIPLRTDFEKPSDICYLKQNGHFHPSPVWDDQSLFVKTTEGLLVLSGCAHRGIINTLVHAREITGVHKIHLVVGGTHLLNTSKMRQERTADMFQELGVDKVGVSHCTGLKPACYLSGRLGAERFFFNNAGTVIKFEKEGIQVNAFEK